VTPTTSYLICATPRSGSTLVCDILRATGVAGAPTEYFHAWLQVHREPSSYRRFMAALARPYFMTAHALVSPFLTRMMAKSMTPNGVFGLKVMSGYFDTFVDALRPIAGCEACPPTEVLDRVLPNLHYVYLTRRDKLGQAISLARAVQSDEWSSPRHRGWYVLFETWAKAVKVVMSVSLRPVVRRQLAYDYDQIASMHDMLVEHDAAWELFFRESGIEPLRIEYESFVRSMERSTRDILDFLGVALSPDYVFRRPIVDRQADSLNAAWRARFLADQTRQGEPDLQAGAHRA
jgi:trehalose 2-sulfotransferase